MTRTCEDALRAIPPGRVIVKFTVSFTVDGNPGPLHKANLTVNLTMPRTSGAALRTTNLEDTGKRHAPQSRQLGSDGGFGDVLVSLVTVTDGISAE